MFDRPLNPPLRFTSEQHSKQKRFTISIFSQIPEAIFFLKYAYFFVMVQCGKLLTFWKYKYTQSKQLKMLERHVNFFQN